MLHTQLTRSFGLLHWLRYSVSFRLRLSSRLLYSAVHVLSKSRYIGETTSLVSGLVELFEKRRHRIRNDTQGPTRIQRFCGHAGMTVSSFICMDDWIILNLLCLRLQLRLWCRHGLNRVRTVAESRYSPFVL
jgi:hypothetical protein